MIIWTMWPAIITMRSSYAKRNCPIKIHLHHYRLRTVRRMLALQMESQTRSTTMRQLVRMRPEVLRGVIGKNRCHKHRSHRCRWQQTGPFNGCHNIKVPSMVTFYEIRQFNHQSTSLGTMASITSWTTKSDRHCFQCLLVDRVHFRSVLSSCHRTMHCNSHLYRIRGPCHRHRRHCQQIKRNHCQLHLCRHVNRHSPISWHRKIWLS